MGNKLELSLKQLGESRYFVSRKGRVYRKTRTGQFVQMSYVNIHGYKRVVLYLNGEKRYFYVHNLVADNFPNDVYHLISRSTPLWDISVRFKDGNRWNCHVSNLYLIDRRKFPATQYDFCMNCNTVHSKGFVCKEVTA